jgi:membrane protein YqaA with SNARE-associated domain
MTFELSSFLLGGVVGYALGAWLMLEVIERDLRRRSRR